ncbi:MAG: hydrogenase [Lentisphaerae bacterium]|nr:hydrogenase [Lentisphaerota bacterium]
MDFASFKNTGKILLKDIPQHDFDRFRDVLAEAINLQNCRVGALFASTGKLYAILIDPAEKSFKAACTAIGNSYPALTPHIAAFHWFEREIFESDHIKPEGHPWLKPIRFENAPQPGVTDYFTLQGNAAHEVAVGPVHAGVIEPGHFRFQCMGEDVYFLEIELGYQHRGIEKMLLTAPAKRHTHLIETAAGDSSIAYALAYDGMAAALAQQPRSKLPERAQILRTLALELERIANHVGDIGALAGDVAFLTSSAYCGRIRGDFLNMTAMLCGNRFGRNYVTYNGVAFDLGNNKLPFLRDWFERTVADFKNAWQLLADDPGVLDRFENTGTVAPEVMRQIGAVGVAARAAGLDIDVRRDLGNIGVYDKLVWQTGLKRSGDVIARLKLRRRELRESIRMVRALFTMLESNAASAAWSEDAPAADGNMIPEALAVTAVEAWRGEVVCCGLTGADGKFKRIKLVDPSFHNWFALVLALRGEQISNFPICNKSFNLSYCGHDL